MIGMHTWQWSTFLLKDFWNSKCLFFVPRHVSFDLFENGEKSITLNCIYAISIMSVSKE